MRQKIATSGSRKGNQIKTTKDAKSIWIFLLCIVLISNSTLLAGAQDSEFSIVSTDKLIYLDGEDIIISGNECKYSKVVFSESEKLACVTTIVYSPSCCHIFPPVSTLRKNSEA